MLTIEPETYSAMVASHSAAFARKLLEWLRGQPKLAGRADRVDESWCHRQIDAAKRHGIDSEDAVARFARLRLSWDDERFARQDVDQVLTSKRSGNLKVFQLECLQEGVTDG